MYIRKEDTYKMEDFKMNINNKKVIKDMKQYILEMMDKSEVLRYKKEFPYELDYNLYTYGNLDVYDYDLFKRLEEFGVTNSSVKEYEKVLDFGCTHNHREKIRRNYKYLVRLAVQDIIKE